MAVSFGCELSILVNADDSVHNSNPNINTENTVIVETELESSIVSVGWDLTDSCVVVGDVSGTLHLFTKEGTLLFSKKILSTAGIFQLL